MFLLLILAVAPLACTRRNAAKPTITVSIEPQRFLLHKLTGNHIDIVCLIQEGVDPETYEPSVSHLMALERSNAYFTVGHIGFEAALIEKIKGSRPDLNIFDTSVGISLDTESRTHPDVDPHVWTSVENARIIAGNMLEALKKVDPDNIDYYNLRYRQLLTQLDTLDNRIHSAVDSVAGAAFLIWHPSLSYFARDYNLHQIMLQPAGKETTPDIIARAIELAKKAHPRVIFYQKEFDPRIVETISRQTGTRAVEINPLDKDWDKQMIHIANAIAQP